ncbi:MAG: 16S rRNA (cytidine(1402)-2'-O)-methyltransferase [Alphaproteobacteria bacterium]|nr:16S rRNA (cytidine(1402)-2'-O)-methyltransferase [Alphaproteobacteria bacterium]
MTRHAWQAPRRAEPKRSDPPGQSPSDLAPGLYVTATPIGNARDVTLRALDVLAGVDLIAAEDTRVTAKLLAIYGLEKPLQPYNDHNGAEQRPRLLKRLREGRRIALVSDAGTPLVSDPGYKLVRESVAQGIAVHAIPGACAPLAGLTLAGLPTDKFLFAGFLPTRAGERKTVLEGLKAVAATLVFFESPQRLGEALADLAGVLGPRPAAVTRELTKLHEEIRRGDLAALAAAYAGETPKGEITLVVGPPPAAEADMRKVDAALARALEFMPLRAAVDLVAEMLDAPRRDVYAHALKRKGDAPQS